MSVKFKYGVVIPIYDRTYYVINTLHQLEKKTSNLDLNKIFFLLIDDGSVDSEKILSIYNNFKTPNKFFIRKPINKGISSSIRMGFDILYSLKVKYLINLDSDINIETRWLNRLVQVYNKIDDKESIVNGWYFPNDKDIEYGENYVLTKTMSGLSSFFHHSLYESIRYDLFENKEIINIENHGKFLEENVEINSKYNKDHWDIALSELFQSRNKKFVCCNPPCFEHIGRNGKNTRLEISDFQKNNFNEFDYLI